MSNTDPASSPVEPRGTRRETSSLENFLGGSPASVALRLLMLSLVVGVILSVIGLDPFNILESIRDLIRWIFYRFDDIIQLFIDTAHWMVRYVLLGAAVVLPIWFVARLLRSGNR